MKLPEIVEGICPICGRASGNDLFCDDCPIETKRAWATRRASTREFIAFAWMIDLMLGALVLLGLGFVATTFMICVAEGC